MVTRAVQIENGKYFPKKWDWLWAGVNGYPLPVLEAGSGPLLSETKLRHELPSK